MPIRQLQYTLDNECPVYWPENFTSKLQFNAPTSFTAKEEQSLVDMDTDFVRKVYLESLWLPDVSEFIDIRRPCSVN